MYKIPLSMIKEKIKEKTGLSEKEINTKIKDKMDLLSGLISEEGAAHILANELGVKIYEDSGKLQIKNILSGMRNVEIEAKVIKIYEQKEFDKNNRKGKIASFLVGDETGIVRVVAWNDKADLLNKIKEQDSIRIENAYSRENNGRLELHLGDKSNIVLIDTPIEVKEKNVIRKKLNELKEGDENIEIFAIITNVFEPKYFEICPECGKRLKPSELGFICDEHNQVNPNYSYVLNLILDDNTETIRAVLWRNQVQNLLKMTDDEILSKKDSSFEEIKTDLIGRFVKMIGRVNKNTMFERLEFIPNLVFIDPNPEEELRRITQLNETDNKKEEKKEISEHAKIVSENNNSNLKSKNTEIDIEEDLLEEIKDLDELDI
ncbi:MAG: OB-fold nucleic acid binding domain-containing protein [Candidatus Woesearchaeota archaeon]